MIHFLSEIDPKNLNKRTVLLRLDFNTEDDWRMRAVLPTIKFLLKNGCKIIILSHRGRPVPHQLLLPNEPMSASDRKFSLKKDTGNLARLLKRRIVFVDHFDFVGTKKVVAESPQGSIFLIENLRFLAGEEKNDPKLAKRMASMGDLYVNDAFAVSHRANASVAAITEFVPSYAGLELEREIDFLSGAMRRPRHPFVFVIGGAKASDKLGVLVSFRKKADLFLLGGGSANTILFRKGMDVKKSLKDEDRHDRNLLAKIARYSNIRLPVDYAWQKDAIVDIGPRTARDYAKKIREAKMILWSGPLGLIDRKPYDQGSLAIARAIARNRKAISIVGGGETVMFLKRVRLDKNVTFVSTGGGAMLDFLAGKKLPGIAALTTASK